MPGAERLSAAADGGCLKGGAPRAVWLVLHADPMTVSARAATEHLIQLGRPPHLVWNPLSGEVTQLIPAVRAGRALGWADGPRWGPRAAGPGGGPGGGPGPGPGAGPGAGQPGWDSGCGWAEAPGHSGFRAPRQDWAGDSDWKEQDDWTHGQDWAQQPGWAQDQDWAQDPGWTHGADWTQGIGWTHGRGQRPLAAAAGRPAAEPAAPPARDGLAGVNNEGRVCVQIGVIGHAWAPFTEGPVVRVREIVSWLDSWHVARGWPAGRPVPFRGAGGPGYQRRRNWARGGHFGASQVPGCRGAGPGAIDIEQLTGPLSGQRGTPARRVAGTPARISAMTWQPRLTAARSAAP
jgi:hypothetical protein